MRTRLSWPTALVLSVALASAAAVLLFAPDDVRTWALGTLAVVGPAVLALMRGLGHGHHGPPGPPPAEGRT